MTQHHSLAVNLVCIHANSSLGLIADAEQHSIFTPPSEKEAVYKNLHSTAEQKQVAEKDFRSLTDRVKEQWTCQRNEELCEMAAKGDFWKVFNKHLSG